MSERKVIVGVWDGTKWDIRFDTSEASTPVTKAEMNKFERALKHGYRLYGRNINLKSLMKANGKEPDHGGESGTQAEGLEPEPEPNAASGDGATPEPAGVSAGDSGGNESERGDGAARRGGGGTAVKRYSYKPGGE